MAVDTPVKDSMAKWHQGSNTNRDTHMAISPPPFSSGNDSSGCPLEDQGGYTTCLRLLTLGNGKTITFMEAEVFTPSISFAADLIRVNATWDDTLENWMPGMAPYCVSGEPIALIYGQPSSSIGRASIGRGSKRVTMSGRSVVVVSRMTLDDSLCSSVPSHGISKIHNSRDILGDIFS